MKDTNQFTRVGTFCEKCRQVMCICSPMQISEQNKQEAEKVIKLYLPIATEYNTFHNHHFVCPKKAYKAAIQDRQSVLEALQKIRVNTLSLDREITNLTEQINYLKSKL